MAKKTTYRVRYHVEYETTITVKPNETVSDVVADISIPYGWDGKYVEDSFEVVRMTEVESK
jgi:hypothetical protein